MKKALSILLCLILMLGCFPLTAMADDTTLGDDEEASISLTTVVPELSSISVTPPTKTEYNVGDTLDTTGMVVTANYTDESTKDVTSLSSLSGFDSSTAGEVTVTVSYTEGEKTVTATFTVTIVTTYSVSLSADPAEGGTVTGAGAYSDGETVTVSATAKSGYRFDHWERGDGSIINDVSFTFIIHENLTYKAVFVEDQTNITKYTLQMPTGVTVTPNEEFTAATAVLSELSMVTGSDGRTPVRLRVILSSGTLINEADNSKTITFHPDSIITTMPALNQCMFDFTSAENRTFYVRIENSSWTSATPGTYTGTMSYIVRWRYDDNHWSGDIETGTIPVTVTIPEQATVYTVTVEPGESEDITGMIMRSTTIISEADMQAGNYTQTAGCFYLGDNGKLYYKLPSRCSFTAPQGKEFDCWEASFGGTFSGGVSFDMAEKGDFTITALWKEPDPDPYLTLSIPATLNINYGDTQTPFDIQVKEAVFRNDMGNFEILFPYSSFQCTSHDGTIPFTVTTNAAGVPNGYHGAKAYFALFKETVLPFSCQGYINITSEDWAAAKPGSYTATLRVQVKWL